MSTTLITYDEAKKRLRLPDDREQAEMEETIAEATAIILKFVDRWENDWTPDTDPSTDQDFAIVRAGIFYEIGILWRFRGDDADQKPEDPAAGAFQDTKLRRILHPLRRPSIA